MQDIIIIGGGLSGLSAAVELCALGHKVVLLEQHQYCGGRVRSFMDSLTGDTLDNGQHLMMGCYHATRRYLHLIGSDHLVSLQSTLRIEFLHPLRYPVRFQCPKVPAPLHLLFGLLGYNVLSVNSRFEMLKVAKELIFISQSKEMELDQITVIDWLVKLGQSDLSRKYLWDVITLGALNNYPQKVSALMLFRVLRSAFLGRRENASLLIPRIGLSELFVVPALRFIEANKGEVRTGVSVADFTFEGTRVRSVRTTDGKELYAKSFISAVPWYSFEKIFTTLSRSTTSDIMNKGDKSPFHSSPIIAIHLWLDKKVTDIDFAALIDTRVQWLFNKSHEAYETVSLEAGKSMSRKTDEQKNNKAKQHLSLVISGAQEFIDMSNELLVSLAMEDLRSVLSEAMSANIVYSSVIKEKRATFLPSPGLEALRPGTRSQFENFFLAGDWTATGYPATIEGAVMSGKKAAETLQNYR